MLQSIIPDNEKVGAGGLVSVYLTGPFIQFILSPKLFANKALFHYKKKKEKIKKRLPKCCRCEDVVVLTFVTAA